jgi:4-amino-4-deoxy-L-arabinose transferase-like glycosyltransferase
VLLLAIAVRLPVLNGGQIDFDEGVYWQSLRALSAGHPLFSSVYSSQPPAFLLLLLPVHIMAGGTLLADRGAVLLLSLIGLVAAYRAVWTLAGWPAALAAVVLLAADPLFMRQSVALQADAPALALGLISLALAAESPAQDGRIGELLVAGSGAALATAILIKLLALPVVPAVVALLAFSPGENRPPAPGRRLVIAAAGAALAAGAFLLPFADRLQAVWNQTVDFHLQARSLALGGLDPGTVMVELPTLALGIAGAFLARRQAPLLALSAVTWSTTAVLLLALHRPLWPHHLLVLTVPLALLGGCSASLVAQLKSGQPAVAALAVVVMSAASALYVHEDQTPDALRKDAVAAQRAATGSGDLVISDDQYSVALAGRATPPSLVDTSKVRVQAGEVTTPKVAAAAEQSHVSCVLVDDHYGSLSQMPGFRHWLRREYPVTRRLSHGRTLHVRARCAGRGRSCIPDEPVSRSTGPAVIGL